MKHARVALACVALAAACRPSGSVPPAPPLRAPIAARVHSARPDGAIQLEGEDFVPAGVGWTKRAWGENLFASTFAISLLSRKAYLSAPARGGRSEASATVRVPVRGDYLALVRYESPYRFATAFELRIAQRGRVVFARRYGARDGMKVYPFGRGLQRDVAFPWGATENIVWEGHDARAALEEGEATVTLVADDQPGDAAERNVDVVFLTRDEGDVAARIANEGYLPLDGLLTQAGDVKLRLTSLGGPISLVVPNGVEHSPYWIHTRTWKPKTIAVDAGGSSPWVEVGDLLDSQNDGEWNLVATAADGARARWRVELGVAEDDGTIAPIARFEPEEATLRLAYDADTRTTRRVRLVDDVLYELLRDVRAFPKKGRAPAHIPIYARGVEPIEGDPRRASAVTELYRLLGVNALVNDPSDPLLRPRGALRRGTRDLRDVPLEKLRAGCAGLRSDEEGEQTAVISVGDEITLPPLESAPPGAFEAFLRSRGVSPSELGVHEEKVAPDPRSSSPAALYWAHVFRSERSIALLAERTALLRACFPHAGVGANFSPHHDAFLGSASQWITAFRRGALTMPWTEDYAWMLPIASSQLVGLPMDVLRAGVRGRPETGIHRYVMAHDPGNTPASFRRLLYGAIAHGAKAIDLFELRPVTLSYTENYVNGVAMYAAIREALHELGTFDDLVVTSSIAPARVALWYSQAGEAFRDRDPPFGAALRTLWLALRHAGLAVDVVDEEDAIAGRLAGYRVLYLTDTHVSGAAGAKLAEWTRAGGRLVATASAGSRTEADAPSPELARVFGVDRGTVLRASSPIAFEKQDLPFARPLAAVRLDGGDASVFGAIEPLVPRDAEIVARFVDGGAAVVRRREGLGEATSFAFLPGLSYFAPAFPRVPVDRSPRAGSSAHFLPTAMDPRIRELLVAPAREVVRPVRTSDPLVEATLLDAKMGAVVVLVSFRDRPIRGLRVEVDGVDGVPTRASGAPIAPGSDARATTLDLDVADALVFRR